MFFSKTKKLARCLQWFLCRKESPPQTHLGWEQLPLQSGRNKVALCVFPTAAAVAPSVSLSLSAGFMTQLVAEREWAAFDSASPPPFPVSWQISSPPGARCASAMRSDSRSEDAWLTGRGANGLARLLTVSFPSVGLKMRLWLKPLCASNQTSACRPCTSSCFYTSVFFHLFW